VAASVKSLPDPLIDPADVMAASPGLSEEDATRGAQLATLAVTAYLYPTPVPDPLSPPVYLALLELSVAIGNAPEGGSPIVSESLGAYSYRKADPATVDELMGLSEQLRRLLEPWARKSCGTTRIWPGEPAVDWPVDWWQRDLDNREAAADAELEVATGVPGVAG
jgi:hypothetical protein